MRNKICAICNTSNPDEAVFCRHCGKRFGNKPLDGDERKGYLSIQSVPTGAPIWIDKLAFGKTPAKVKLDEGEHRVFIGNDKETDSIQTVYVRRNETTRINVKLANNNTQTIQSSGKIFGQTSYTRDGIIQVQCSQRNVVVKIDDHYVGIAPLKASVKEGLHKVRLSNGNSFQTYNVNVKRGEIAYLKANISTGANSSKKQNLSTTPAKSKNNNGCLWTFLFILIIAASIIRWGYSNYFANSISALEAGLGQVDDRISENMINYGDNLMVPKTLLPEYEELVNSIYIDLSYNIGEENCGDVSTATKIA